MSSGVRGLLDTSVVIDLDLINSDDLPDETAISAITLAELAAGPHAAMDKQERGRWQDRLQWAASSWDPLPLDAEVARAYGRLYATMRASSRGTRRRRFADLLVAATALAACGKTHAAFDGRCIPPEPPRFAGLCVALRSKYTRASSPGGGSSLVRLVSRAPRPSRRSRGFHHRLLAHGLPLFTRNPADFSGLEDLVEINAL